MADSIVEAVQQAAENVTENDANVKIPASPEGMFIAYGSLVLMAMLPIMVGR
jgi:minor histocompatibility antigen H13